MPEGLKYIGGGGIRLESACVFPKRVVSHYRLLHVISGQGILTFDERCVSICGDNVYLLRPGPRQVTYAPDEPIDYEYVEFDASTTLIHTPCLTSSAEGVFRAALTCLLTCTNLEQDDLLRLRLLDIAIRLTLEGSAERLPEDPRLQKVWRHLEEQPNETFTVANLAAFAGLSEPQFRRLFRRYFGVSPKSYLMRHRMDYARRLMEAEHMRVCEVADALGFASPYQFSAQFRKVHGCCPSRIRSDHQETCN